MSKLSTAQIEIIRLSLLRYLKEAGQLGLSEAMLIQFVKAEGFRSFDEDAADTQLLYLMDKAMITPVTKLLSPAIKSWRITAAGIDHTEAQG